MLGMYVGKGGGGFPNRFSHLESLLYFCFRWDFETEDEYNAYMENKVAMPKAAFQFGIKMHEGRKTRTKAGAQMSEKQKLDREWQQISNLISKRKGDGGHGSGGKKSKD